MMKSGRAVATALCALGTTSAFTGPLASSFRASKSVARQVSRNAGRNMQMAAVAEGYDLKVKGEENTMDYRAFFNQGGKEVSPWHDIPLKAGAPDTFNYVCEIPKYSLAKMEIATDEPNNPIAQDTKKGKLRFYHGPIFWNYGYIPQTWEDPTVKHPELGVFGDGDPVDVVEIGSAKLASGSVKAIKPLGCLAMIDDGELDWKVIAIDVDDPLAKDLNDIADVEKLLPGYVSGIREWFRWYKTPDDKPLNGFGFEERALNKAETMKIIDECNVHWRNLCDGKTEAGKMWIK